jgi:hypothetical protein
MTLKRLKSKIRPKTKDSALLVMAYLRSTITVYSSVTMSPIIKGYQWPCLCYQFLLDNTIWFRYSDQSQWLAEEDSSRISQLALLKCFRLVILFFTRTNALVSSWRHLIFILLLRTYGLRRRACPPPHPHPQVMPVCYVRRILESSQHFWNEWKITLSVDAIPETTRIV